MAKMTGGQAITASLMAQGVDTVFGIISVHTLDLFDSLFDNQDSLRLIGGRLELGCGYMADGYYRATGKPGVLLTSTGPGAADSVGALGEAYFSGSAVLEITTNVEQEFVNAGRLATHETKDQPVGRDGQVVLAQMMKATLSVDHRVADGAEAAQFLMEVKRLLESPARMLL